MNPLISCHNRPSMNKELNRVIGMYGITLTDKHFIIPNKEEYGVLYNDGEIGYDEIAGIDVGGAFVRIHLTNGYLFHLYCQEPLLTCTYMNNTANKPLLF